jgi:hypothetical protein
MTLSCYIKLAVKQTLFNVLSSYPKTEMPESAVCLLSKADAGIKEPAEMYSFPFSHAVAIHQGDPIQNEDRHLAQLSTQVTSHDFQSPSPYTNSKAAIQFLDWDIPRT